MAIGFPVARWLIDLATANPPRDREEWALAMRAEFDSLDDGRLVWALGCLSTAIRWRLVADAAFIIAILGSIFALSVIIPRLNFWLIYLIGWRYMSIEHIISYAYAWAPPALVCILLSLMRPKYYVFIGLFIPLASLFAELVYSDMRLGLPVSIMDARLDVGIGALTGYSLIGSLIGRSLSGRERQRV